jgi:ABC-type lipoprotein export system ATPase subunit
MATPILECRDVSKHYEERSVLENVCLRLIPGERLALTGPSGSGKTTLLNCLGGIDRPDQGAILVDGENICELPRESLASLRRTAIGNIFQFFHLLPTLTVRENVEFPLHLLGVPKTERRELSLKILERVGIAHRIDAQPSRLSGGEMQRVAIARALIHRPRLLLADEPTGNLDSQNGANILGLLEELTQETGTALLLVTHSEEATKICHRVLRMRDGKILGQEQESETTLFNVAKLQASTL